MKAGAAVGVKALAKRFPLLAPATPIRPRNADALGLAPEPYYEKGMREGRMRGGRMRRSVERRG